MQTTPSLVRALVDAQFPAWKELQLEAVATCGTEFALYRLGGELVVRLPRHERTVATLEVERAWLPRIASCVPVAVPEPVAAGAPAPGYPFPWAVYRWLDGDDMTVAPVDDLDALALDLAAFLRALWRLDAPDGPQPVPQNAHRGVPLQRRDDAVRAAMGTLAAEIDGDRVRRAWESALAAHAWDREPVLIHGDLDARNLVVRNGTLSGVLDFGCLAVGDPACDVMVAWKALAGEPRQRFRAALHVDDATWERARGWVLSQALIALAYYTLETNPILVREARRWLTSVLDSS